MITEMQLETMSVETVSLAPIAEDAAIVQLGEDELDLCSGGAQNSGTSTSGFSRNRMAMTKGTFAGPEGSGSFQTVMTEEVSSFAQEDWDIFQ